MRPSDTITILALVCGSLVCGSPVDGPTTPSRRQMPVPEGAPEPTEDESPPPPAPPSLPMAVVNGCAPAFGKTPQIVQVNLPEDSVLRPRSLAFNPIGDRELWIADTGRNALTRAILDQNRAVEEVMVTKDRAEYHYLDNISSISFTPTGEFATCQESVNFYQGNMLANFFMGPTMYDTAARGWVNSKLEACAQGETCYLVHTDMLHESPLCMGIAHDNSVGWHSASIGKTYRNAFWAFGGGHSQLVRFDFREEHGPGSMDHSIAEVRRYTGLRLSRVEGIPSSMAVDDAAKLLYVADTGADRVVLVRTDSGYYTRNAKEKVGQFEAYAVYSSPLDSFEYEVWDGLEFSVFASVDRPSGIAISPSTLYVGSHTQGTIYAFMRSNGELLSVLQAAPRQSLFGIVLETKASASPEGELYYIGGNGVHRVAIPTGSSVCSATLDPAGTCNDGVKNGDETDVDCGGRYCARCALNTACSVSADCNSTSCVSGLCTVAQPYIHQATILEGYLSSPFYYNSFLHHAIHQDSMAASYLNPYPIMDQNFCETVGMNLSLPLAGQTPDCGIIDFDALLMGGCFCHYCLRNLNPCVNGGTCVNYRKQGYTCACSDGYHGDHCQYPPTQPVPSYKLPNNFTVWPYYVYPYKTPSNQCVKDSSVPTTCTLDKSLEGKKCSCKYTWVTQASGAGGVELVCQP